MIKPWECSVCHERFGSLFKGSIHARNHQGAPPAVIVYKLEGQPVKRCLQPEDRLDLASSPVATWLDLPPNPVATIDGKPYHGATDSWDSHAVEVDDESMADRAVQAEIDIACGLGSDDDWLLP